MKNKNTPFLQKHKYLGMIIVISFALIIIGVFLYNIDNLPQYKTPPRGYKWGISEREMRYCRIMKAYWLALATYSQENEDFFPENIDNFYESGSFAKEKSSLKNDEKKYFNKRFLSKFIYLGKGKKFQRDRIKVGTKFIDNKDSQEFILSYVKVSGISRDGKDIYLILMNDGRLSGRSSLEEMDEVQKSTLDAQSSHK